MRQQRLAASLVVVLFVAEVQHIQAVVKPSVKDALTKISTTLRKYGKNVQKKIDEIHKYLDTDDGKDLANTVAGSIEKVGSAVKSVTSSDVLKIVGGTMEMVSAISALIPKYGKVVSAVFGLVGQILGAVGGGTDMGSIVKREIEKALDNYDDSELRAEAEGTMRVYRLSQAYLNYIEGEANITEHEVATLAANIPVYSGINFLGTLAAKIHENTESSDPTQVQRAAEYLQLYVILSVMRTTVLWEMYYVVRGAGHSNWTAAAINRAVEAEQDHDKSFLEFLEEPEYSQAVFFAFFNPSDYPVTMKFMAKNGLAYQRLEFLNNGKHFLRPEKWTDWYLKMGGDVCGIMKGTEDLNSQSEFYFDTISAENNLFHIRNCRWPDWYVRMTNDVDGNCRGWDEEPGPNGEWKVVKFKDGKYLISPIRWPNWFIYMKNDIWGHIRGSKGDPGVQGHWLID